MLKSTDSSDIEGALTLLWELNNRTLDERILNGSLALMAELLDREDIRERILEFLARGADHLPRADTEVLKQLREKLKSISNTQKGKYKEMVQLLLDVIDDVLSSRKSGQ